MRRSFSRMSKETFLYFGYGSNLLKQRLQLKNPTAVYQTIGKLENYRLNFDSTVNPKNTRWHGAVATIEPRKDWDVWGTVWQLGVEDIPSLDRQESTYKSVYVDVVTPDDRTLTCRTYLLGPHKVSSNWDLRPSPQYLDVIVKGAISSNLPEDYIAYLKQIETNGFPGPVKIHEEVMKLLN